MQKMYKVTNRSSGVVAYTIPEMNIRREFSLGETKNLSHEELEQLTFIPGGKELLRDYLLVRDEEVKAEIGLETEPEYNLDEAAIVNLIKNGDMIDWENTLNFAPLGVIELIKAHAITLPLTDMNKAQMLKEKTGFDAIAAMRLLADDEPTVVAEKPVRKSHDEVVSVPEKPVRKTSNKANA